MLVQYRLGEWEWMDVCMYLSNVFCSLSFRRIQEPARIRLARLLRSSSIINPLCCAGGLGSSMRIYVLYVCMYRAEMRFESKRVAYAMQQAGDWEGNCQLADEN